jgi:hypothetical protein
MFCLLTRPSKSYPMAGLKRTKGAKTFEFSQNTQSSITIRDMRGTDQFVGCNLANRIKD